MHPPYFILNIYENLYMPGIGISLFKHILINYIYNQLIYIGFDIWWEPYISWTYISTHLDSNICPGPIYLHI